MVLGRSRCEARAVAAGKAHGALQTIILRAPGKALKSLKERSNRIASAFRSDPSGRGVLLSARGDGVSIRKCP